MATINYQLSDGPLKKVEFRKELRIGSDTERNQLVLPVAAKIASEHAIITRAVIGKLPVLVNLAGYGLRVNRQNVVTLRVLHHGDTIEIGDTELKLREMQIKRLTDDAHRVCPPCDGVIEANDEIVSCPNCEVMHHRVCWFYQENCSSYACQYPIHQTAIEALSPPATFVTNLEKSHKLVANKRVCAKNPQSDLGVPFQEHNDVAFCPKCESALHLHCWLISEKCPACEYAIKELMDDVFDAPSLEPIM